MNEHKDACLVILMQKTVHSLYLYFEMCINTKVKFLLTATDRAKFTTSPQPTFLFTAEFKINVVGPGHSPQYALNFIIMHQ